MSNSTNNVPRLRFPGFTDAWEQRKLKDLAESFEYGLNAAAKEYDGKNKYLRITDINDDTREFMLENLTSPDTDLFNADNYRLKEGDILFARTGASVGKSYIYKDSDGLVYYAGFLIRTRVKSDYDAEFIFQNTLTSNYEKYIQITSQRSGQPGVNAQEYADYPILVPNYNEQVKIGRFLSSLDKTITLHQCKLDCMKEYKKGMLQKMFPKEGETEPEIRFPGFAGAWKQRKLGDISIKVTRVNNNDNAPIMMISTPSNGYIFQSDRYGKDNTGDSLKKYTLLLRGELSYNHGASKLRPFGSCFVMEEKKALIPFVYHSFSTPKDVAKFVSLQLNLDQMQNNLRKLISSGARMDGLLNISYDEYMSLPICMPSYKEQELIANYFNKLENIITLHQHKLDQMKEYKKGLLQQMFV